MRVTSTRTGQSRLLRIRTGKFADLLMRLTAEEGSTVTEDSMVVTWLVMAVAESSCSEGVRPAVNAGRTWGVTESKTASGSSVAFASGMSSVSEVDISGDGGCRVVGEGARADGGALDVRGFAGGHVREARGGDPARGEERAGTAGEVVVDGGSARCRREQGARGGGAFARDDRRDGGEGLLGVERVAAGSIPRQDRGDVCLLGEDVRARPVCRGLTGRRVDVDARHGGEGDLVSGGQC